MEIDPTAKVEVEIFATPLERGAVPMDVPLAVNWTVPVGVGPPEFTGATWAERARHNP